MVDPEHLAYSHDILPYHFFFLLLFTLNNDLTGSSFETVVAMCSDELAEGLLPASKVGNNAGIHVQGGKQSEADHCSSEQDLIQHHDYNLVICEISYVPTYVTPTTQC